MNEQARGCGDKRIEFSWYPKCWWQLPPTALTALLLTTATATTPGLSDLFSYIYFAQRFILQNKYFYSFSYQEVVLLLLYWW